MSAVKVRIPSLIGEHTTDVEIPDAEWFIIEDGALIVGKGGVARGSDGKATSNRATLAAFNTWLFAKLVP